MLTDDVVYMQRCISLAKKAMYSVKTGAKVGCVIVRDNQVIAEGWHQFPGQAHAEVIALNKAGNQVKGAVLYVSLEPCSHWGKTGPCCEAIISAGIKKVVFGMIDPNPQVSGQGIKKLKEAGIDVVGPVLAEECAQLNIGFIKRMRTGLPYVRCKLAMSLDGRTAMASGESKWITGVEARKDVQFLRASSSAIVTGIGTVLSDDPSLNQRLQNLDVPQPLRVVVDSKFRIPASAKILIADGEVLIATAKEIDDPSILSKCFPGKNINNDEQVDLKAMMEFLAKDKQCNDVLLESGPILAGAMLKAGLIDEIITYIAPSLLGSDARPLLDLPGIKEMSQKIKLRLIDVEKIGEDCKIRTQVLYSENMKKCLQE